MNRKARTVVTPATTMESIKIMGPLNALAIFLAIALPALATAQSSDRFGVESEASYELEVGAYQPDVVEYFDDYSDTTLGQYDPDAPDLDYVWVDAQILEDGSESPGFYRLRTRPGLLWVDGYYDPSNRWVPPGWQPRHHRRGSVWVTGHRGHDGYWVPGHWRQRTRASHRWVDGYWNGSEWVPGVWIPILHRPVENHVWVQGYWSNGIWIDGFWRPNSRPGFTWTAGSWRYGAWVPGFWQPHERRGDSAWTPGYYGRNGWVNGSWRPKNRPGFVWVGGHIDRRGRYVNGHWERQRATRRHRVYRVQDMTHRRWDSRRIWENGRVRRHNSHGLRMERKGRRIHERPIRTPHAAPPPARPQRDVRPRRRQDLRPPQIERPQHRRNSDRRRQRDARHRRHQ